MSLKSSSDDSWKIWQRPVFQIIAQLLFPATPPEGLDRSAKWKVHHVYIFLPLPHTSFITSARHMFNFWDIFLITQGLSSILAKFPLI